MDVVRDAVETAVNMGLFKTIAKATAAAVFSSYPDKLTMTQCKDMDNFNPDARLLSRATRAYPTADRPRGEKDVNCVKYWARQIRRGVQPPPIWVLKNKFGYTLLDGAHRIVAHYIAGKRVVPCIVVDVTRKLLT